MTLPRRLSSPKHVNSHLLTRTEPTPDEKAAEIINAVPSSSLWSKTGGVILGTGVAAAAVSTELYVSPP